jgi:hypothetical protein
MNSEKGTTSNLKDLQIQCSKGTSIFTSWLCLCLCLALFILLLFSQHGFTLGNELVMLDFLDECAWCEILLMDS